MRKTGRTGGRRIAAAALAALALAAGCRGGGEPEQEAPPPAAPAPGEGVQVEIVLPDSLGWAQEGDVQLRVANRGRTPLEGARLELFVQAPARTVPAVAAGGDGAQVQPSTDGTRVLLPVAPLAPGQAADFVQRVQLPPSPGTGAADTSAAGRFVVRARVLGPGDVMVGTAAEDTLAVFAEAGPALGCGAGGRLPITRYGVGTVRLGLTRAQVEALCPGVRDTTWAGQEGMRERGLVVPFGARDTLVVVLAGETVSRLRVVRPGLATATGAGVGTTLGELRARYGRTCAGVGEGRVAVWFPNAPGISFALSAQPPATWSRVERDPSLLPDTASVTELWVRKGTDDCPAPAGAGTGEEER